MSPPFHLFFFSPTTIDRLLAMAGFRMRRIVYDGVVTTTGPLASPRGRRVAALAGAGNVMTVYAQRTHAAIEAPSRLRRVTARYRPLGLVRGAWGRPPTDERGRVAHQPSLVGEQDGPDA